VVSGELVPGFLRKPIQEVGWNFANPFIRQLADLTFHDKDPYL